MFTFWEADNNRTEQWGWHDQSAFLTLRLVLERGWLRLLYLHVSVPEVSTASLCRSGVIASLPGNEKIPRETGRSFLSTHIKHTIRNLSKKHNRLHKSCIQIHPDFSHQFHFKYWETSKYWWCFMGKTFGITAFPVFHKEFGVVSKSHLTISAVKSILLLNINCLYDLLILNAYLWDVFACQVQEAWAFVRPPLTPELL